MRHELKCWPANYAAVLSGVKSFEVRRDDRDPPFDVDDELLLREWDPLLSDGPSAYTGRALLVRVSYVTRGEFMRPRPLCVMAIERFDAPIDARARIVSLEPGDVLVVEAAERFDEEQRDRIREHFRRELTGVIAGGIPVLLLENGMKFQAIRPPRLDNAADTDPEAGARAWARRAAAGIDKDLEARGKPPIFGVLDSPGGTTGEENLSPGGAGGGGENPPA